MKNQPGAIHPQTGINDDPIHQTGAGASSSPDVSSPFELLQTRLITLLLRYDQHSFSHLFGIHTDFEHEPDDPALKPYRDLAVLLYLRDKLFEHILPRIVGHLSFNAPRTLVIEDSPSQGSIDWERTLAATWDERPDEAPLHLYTRQRQRNFATPENLLTVATLLEYHDHVQHLLWHRQDVPGINALHQSLTEIVERCERELAFPQFAGLRQDAQSIIEGSTTETIDTLEARVQLLPASSSAYAELLTWRQRLHSLHLLRPEPSQQAGEVLGGDPQQRDYLYHSWLFYELADMLSEQGYLDHLATTPEPMRLRFRWGTADQERVYELRYQQPVPDPLTGWSATTHAANGTGSYPGFYLWRVVPPVHQIVHNGQRFWREPGMLWEAHYHDDHASSGSSSPPVKQMVADLSMLGERYGAFIYAEASAEHAVRDEEHAGAEDVVPGHGLVTRLTSQPPWQEIAVWHIQPDQPAVAGHLHRVLTALLNDAHTRLGQPDIPRCHGVFLASLGTTAHGVLASAADLVQRSVTRSAPLDDLLICPKPHINPWRVDIVSLQHDCCTNPAICHIMHLPAAQKPQRLTTLSDIVSAFYPSQSIRKSEASEDDPDDYVAQVATSQVLTNVKYYVQLLQPDIERYHRWVRDRLELGDLFETTLLLTDTQREALALGRFLWEQVEQIGALNFAGPALLFCGVLEELTRATIYTCCPELHDRFGKPLMKGLGALGRSKDFGGKNWIILKQSIVFTGRWKKRIARRQTLTFSLWINHIKTINYIRNRAAHQAYVSADDFEKLAGLYFGNLQYGFGVFNGLLLAWRAPE